MIPPRVPIHLYKERDSLRNISGQPVAIKVEDIADVRDAAHFAAVSGNTLTCVIFASALSLDRIQFTEDMSGIPMVVIPASFGKFRRLEKKIETMRKLDLTIFLPPDAPNLIGARILSSIGIKTAIMLGPETRDFEPVIDLAAYALLGPSPHAPIEPFEYIAGNYEPSKPVDWEFLLLEETAGSKIPDVLCRDCTAWGMCRGRFVKSSDFAACSGFYHELIELIETRRRKESHSGQKPQREVIIRDNNGRPPRSENNNLPLDPDIFETSVPWINASGTAGDALLLSSVLKQVMETYPKRRFNLVARNHFGNVLAGHPAILTIGHPPKDAPIPMLGIDSLAGGPSDFTPYQVIARKLGLQEPVDEKFYVPWQFEDDPVICKMVRRGMYKVLIVHGNDGSGYLQQKDWESLVGYLRDRNVHAVQAGSRDEPFIRGSYSVLGLLNVRQLISFPRKFEIVVTDQDLLLYAARLCSVPCVDVRKIPRVDGLLPKIGQFLT